MGNCSPHSTRTDLLESQDPVNRKTVCNIRTENSNYRSWNRKMVGHTQTQYCRAYGNQSDHNQKQNPSSRQSEQIPCLQYGQILSLPSGQVKTITPREDR